MINILNLQKLRWTKNTESIGNETQIKSLKRDIWCVKLKKSKTDSSRVNLKTLLSEFFQVYGDDPLMYGRDFEDKRLLLRQF